MANATSIQILEDGAARTVIKLEGVLDTADVTTTVIIDPAVASSVDPTGSNYLKATKFRIDKIIHNIEDGLSVNFYWDATTPVRIEQLTGRGKADYRDFGGLQNNAGATGFTGKITYITEGWSGIKTFSIILYLTKQF